MAKIRHPIESMLKVTVNCICALLSANKYRIFTATISQNDSSDQLYIIAINAIERDHDIN